MYRVRHPHNPLPGVVGCSSEVPCIKQSPECEQGHALLKLLLGFLGYV